MRSDVAAAWTWVAVLAGAEALGAALWVAAGLVSVFEGRGWAAPSFSGGAGPIIAVVTGRDGIARVPVLVIAGVLLAGVAVAVMQAASLVRGRHRSRAALAEAARVNTRADVAGITVAARNAELPRLHPELAAKRAGSRTEIEDIIGEVIPAGPAVAVGLEDVEVAWMAPRSGKTSARAIPRLLAAPGPAVATANKPDLYQATMHHRSACGRVWRFDPQGVVRGAKQEFWWNPLRAIVDDESARQFAMQFVQQVTSPGGDTFWPTAAADVLSAMFLAASFSGRTLRDVWFWLLDPAEELPVQILRDHGMAEVAEALHKIMYLYQETRDSVYQTARTAASCLRNRKVLAWVTPQPGLPELNLRSFATSTDTVYLLSRDTAGAPGPLLAGFLDQAFDAFQEEAEDNGGRLPIPATLVLDEVGNIAPWDRLPRVVSFAGSIGVLMLVILQSWAQGSRVWGENGMEQLFGATTVKTFGAGIDDERLLRRLSTAVGQDDVARTSSTHGAGGTSETVSVERQDLLPPDAVRALPKGTALVMITGRRPVVVRLRPWFTAPYRQVVEESLMETRKLLRGSR